MQRLGSDLLATVYSKTENALVRELRCEEFDRNPKRSHDPHSTGSFVEADMWARKCPRARGTRYDRNDEAGIAHQAGRHLTVHERMEAETPYPELDHPTEPLIAS
jgi:hypothetical protein